MPVMPFGKYRGRSLSEIPGSYLRWCLANLEEIDPWLRREMEARLGQPPRRESNQAPPPPRVEAETIRLASTMAALRATRETNQRWAEAIRRHFRDLSLRFHPDKGGSHQAMVALNAFKERLEETIR